MANNKSPFKLVMISAMYENGGNTTQRLLDGHPEFFHYPFESQPGTAIVSDYLTSTFPTKYRWPEFYTSGNFAQDYEAIIDEELKRHVKTPFASKFKTAKMRLDDKERKKIFLELLKGKQRTRANIVEAFFVATFKAWKDYKKSGKEKGYIGYSPIIGVDAEKIFADLPNAHVIHVVRNPFSAYAETKRRPVPYSPFRYIHTWNIVQTFALTFANKFPKNFHLVRFEDIMADRKKVFTELGEKIGFNYYPSLEYVSWNGRKLSHLVPWGTIDKPSTKTNIETAKELNREEYQEVKTRTMVLNKVLGYDQEF